ncbi:serine-rich adhesin for platelets-like, partial [Ylistrum balloti]|uniref:serine-rich adhesin for platelets-like n=1 Tax=Ylistrum balloti TaxID=509963 RepID=UPI002905C6EE
MNGRHTSEYSSDLEMSPSDIIEIEESPIKSKKKKKKSFSLDSRNYTCRSSSSRRPEQGKTAINISEIDDRSTLNSTNKKTEGSNKGLKNKSGYKGIKRKASSPKTETGKLTDDSDSSDEELHQRRSSTGKRIKRGLAKRLHRNTDNSQVNQGVPSGSELDSQDGWYSTIKSQSLSSSQTYRHIGSRDSHQPNSKISSRFSHDQPISISTSSSIPKLSTDANVLKQAKEPLHKKCITYQDSDPSSEGFEPIISDKGMNHLSPSSSSDDLFLTQTPAKQKPKARKIVSSDTTVDSDATVNDSDSTIYSPLHQNVPDIPDLTLKFMSSSSEEELDKKMVHLVRKNSKSSKKQCYPVGRHREDISTKHTTSHTDINSLNSYHHRNSGESQESESLFGKPPSLSQHINDDDDPYKFPSQSQCRTQSMPSLEQMINSSSKVSTKSPQDGRGEITDQDITTDSDVDVPLASLAFNKYKALKGQSSVKREVSEVDDDGNSEFNLWPQSDKRIRLGPYSGNCYKVKEESEPETQNYSIGSETTHKESAGPDTTSIVDDKSNIKEILVPKTEPPSYGYTQDLDVVFVEDSDSDYEDMSQKIVEISSDEDDELQDYDDAAEFKAYFNLPDCDSDDNDLQVRGHRRDVDGDTTSSNTASNIDWVTFDSDDDFSYGLLNQDVSGDDSVYNHPTQKDTENKVKFVKEVVTFDESDDDNYPYGIATQVDKGKQLDRVKDERSHDDMDSLYTADTQLDDVDSNGENARCHDEMDSLYTADTQLDDVDSNGENARCHDEMDSIYSAETQLDDDQRPDVYIDVDGIDEEKVDVKVEILDIADTGKEVSEIDPFDLCMPVMRSNLESNVNQQFKSYRTDWSNKSEKKLKSQSLKKSNKSQTVTSSHERLYEDNVYTVQTQVDGATIRGAGDYEDDIFTAQTQIDGTINSGTDDNGNDIFSAQTQVDGPVNTSGTDDEDIYAAQTQVDGSAVINGTDDEDIYTAQTQVDGSAVISGTDDEDIYAAQTQVDGSAVISGTDDEDIYAAQTQVDGSAVISGTEDEDIYTAQTQVDGSAVISGTDDEDIYTAQTQVDGSAVISGTDDEDIYASQTQVDGSAVSSGTEDEDIYAAQTQIDGGLISGTEDDIYAAQTQVDRTHIFTSEKGDDSSAAYTSVPCKKRKFHFDRGKMRNQVERARFQIEHKKDISGTTAGILQLNRLLSGEEVSADQKRSADFDSFLATKQKDRVGDAYLDGIQMDREGDSSRKEDSSDVYMAETQIDNIIISRAEEEDRGKTHVSSKTITGHKNTPVNSEEQMDTESYDVEAQYDLPSPNSTLPIPKEKHIQREKSIVSSIDKIRFKNLIPIKKTVLPTEPQRLKNRCEKSESFRIEKSTFYSKKSGKVPYQNSASKKLTSSMDGWLSTARSSKSRVQPETKRSRSKKQPKEQLDNSQQIKAKMSKARAQMSSRQQSSVKPTAHRKTSIS